MRVQYQANNELISLIDGKLSQKIKSGETLWVMSEGRVRIHLGNENLFILTHFYIAFSFLTHCRKTNRKMVGFTHSRRA